MKFLDLKPKGKVVFVGDTHGDLEASKKVINKYLKSGTYICFLGDYVDRGPQSAENADYLIKVKKENPKNLILLQGNHENYMIDHFYPCEFWEKSSSEQRTKYDNIFRAFPLVLSAGGIIALHGALPDINNLEDINKIQDLDKNWKAITWGDIYEGEENNFNTPLGRPLYGKKYFEDVMTILNKKILIRAHDPHAKEKMLNNKCLTIFTSCAYRRERTIAIADFSKKIESIDDLIIENIDN